MAPRAKPPAPAEGRRHSRGRSWPPGGFSPLFADLLIGRDAELAALGRRLADRRCRLLTLTGPPGVGKTRLAAAVMEAHVESTGDHGVFVDLSALRDPALLAAETAHALGVEYDDDANVVDAIAAAIEHDTLVVLDNCEHLLAAAPELGRLLAACRRLRVLATSRERLRLAAEQEFAVPPLAMPSHGDARDLAALMANPSVALLVDRACRVHPQFALTTRNAAAVVDACVRLEGLPLAIELAAARLRALSVADLALRLADRMQLLSVSARDVPYRHRALRAAIDWSYDLLSPAERRLFRRLSVFAGRWGLEDAEQVCGEPAEDLLVSLESLLDKSLISRASGAGEATEFSMLESLREYAAEQLALHDETDRLRDRHATHYAAMAVRFEATFGLPEERGSWLRLGRYQANLRVALDYCKLTGRHPEAVQLATAIGWYCYTRGNLGDGRAVVDGVLSLVDDGRARTTDHWAGALVIGGVLAWSAGRLDRAEPLLMQALVHSERSADLRRSTVARAFLGHVARALGRHDDSARWHREAMAGFLQLGNGQGVAWARHDLAQLARERGDLDEAATSFRRTLREFHDLDYPWAAAWSAWGLATVLLQCGSVDEAGPLLAEALQTYLELGDTRGVAQCLEVLAQLAGEHASYEVAGQLLGAAAAQRGRLAAPTVGSERAGIAVLEETLLQRLGPHAAERERLAGRAMPIEKAAALALAVAVGDVPADRDREPPTVLTRRERQVVTLVASGRTNRQIGRALGIAEKTAEIHLQHVMAKLDAHSRAEVAAWAVSHRVHDPVE